MARKIIGREKRYVEVDVRFEPDGHLRPLAIRFGPEQVYQIDKIKDVSRRAAEVGGVGDRYVCVIHGQETNLWMEKGAGLWKPSWWPKRDNIHNTSKCRERGESFSASRRFASISWHEALLVVRLRPGDCPGMALGGRERYRDFSTVFVYVYKIQDNFDNHLIVI